MISPDTMKEESLNVYDLELDAIFVYSLMEHVEFNYACAFVYSGDRKHICEQINSYNEYNNKAIDIIYYDKYWNTEWLTQ